MAFCTKEKQLVTAGTTAVSNKFIVSYMPDAQGVASSVYLLGLALADSLGADNSIDTIAQKLGITAEDVMACYEYWEELGLVHIACTNPPEVVYLSLESDLNSQKRIKPSKYSKFSKQIQNVITGRMLTVNEYNAYYMFLEDTTFEPDALVAVAKYCVALKGNDINYNYVLTVARNQWKKGATTLAVVEDNFNSQQKYDDDLSLVFKALKLSRNFDYEDRELYEKWTKHMQFTQDVICKVATRVKTGGMKKLDALLSDYYKHNALSVKEIENYEQTKTDLFQTAKDVTKCLGLYYQSLDMVVEEYVTKWVSHGFNLQMLVAVAKYAFRCAIRTLAGFDSVMEKLYINGITDIVALEQYLAEIAQKDQQIKEILNLCGLQRNVTQSDRNLFAVWTEKWAMPVDVVQHVATKSAGALSPLQYINKVLADYKQKGIFTVESALAQTQTTTTTAQPKIKRALIGGIDIQRHEYTDEQLGALFTVLDEGDD